MYLSDETNQDLIASAYVEAIIAGAGYNYSFQSLQLSHNIDQYLLAIDAHREDKVVKLKADVVKDGCQWKSNHIIQFEIVG